MLKKIVDWIKENPWMAGGLAVGAVILIYLARRNSAAAQGTSQPVASQGVAGTGLSESGYITLQEAGLQASQNIQAVQLQAAVQTSAQQSALQAAQAQYANQLAIAQIQGQVNLQQIQSTASSADLATQSALQASLAQTGAAVSEAQIAADEAVQISHDQTSVQLAQVAATNTANSVIAQLAGILAGVPGNPPQPTPTPTPVVVPTVPPTQTTGGSITPPVTSQPPATVPAVASSSLIPYDQITTNEWYQLIAIETNQPLAQIQSLYSQTQPGSTITNLQQTVGAHSTAQSAYAYYAGTTPFGQSVSIDPQTGKVTANATLTAVLQQLGNVNPWAYPAGTPLT